MKKPIIYLFLGGIALAVANQVFVYAVQSASYSRDLTFGEESAALGESDSVSIEVDPSSFDEIPASLPFLEIDLLDEEAHSWSTNYSQFGGAGILVFDANNDDLLDVYLVHDGQNWVRATDDNATLLDKPRYQSNVLYLNTGNDDNGMPKYKRLDEASSNGSYDRAELLVEGYLFPREGVEDSKDRYGRQSNVAVAADINGDGRPDLIVGNQTIGFQWSSENTQRVLNRFVSPVGREARHGKSDLAGLGVYFLADYQANNGTDETRKSARGIEAEGANSVFLNMGDQDADGLPEWKDVTREVGLEGVWTTYGISVADIDLDGDLDIYTANVMDADYWPGGSQKWAGGANQLYINQLADSGELKFIDMAKEMNVDTVFDHDHEMPEKWRVKQLPFLPREYSVALMEGEGFKPEPLVINGEPGEYAEISWATVFQDYNLDGYPDIWVANDLGMLRLFENQGGEKFVERKHARSEHTGDWMTFAAADFNGDLSEDMLVGNLGGAFRNHGFVVPDPFASFEPVMVDSLAFAEFLLDKHDSTHVLIDGQNVTQELAHKVRHSKVLPPDAAIPGNIRSDSFVEYNLSPFDQDTLDPYEFAWGMTAFDMQNDGRQDLYYLGCLYGRGGGLFPITGTAPGRLLVNATPEGKELRLVDLTAEHHAFNIEEMKYDRLESEGYIYRRAPSQNWRKRDMVYSYDRSSWISQGPGIQEKQINQDMIQTSEMGRAVVSADLNGDGFEDLILTNLGGYDSRSSKARNLKANINGRPQVLPSPDFNYPSLTNFEPGRTKTFMNQYSDKGWISIRLVDDSPNTFNQDAIGARVVVNGQHLRVQRAGEGGYLGNKLVDVHVGLGDKAAQDVEITWPDKQQTLTKLKLDNLSRGTVVVSKTKGMIRWIPAISDGHAEANP